MLIPDDEIIVLPVTESSNNYAMGLIQKGVATHGTAVRALEQTGGKGRHHRPWLSNHGDNILLSVITRMEGYLLHDNFRLSMIAALAVCDMLENNAGVKAFVKWPNDVFLSDKKAAGILIENVIRGTLWQWAVTGFGININQTDFGEGINGTSLKIEDAKTHNVNDLAYQLRRFFLERLTMWKSSQQIVDEYNSRLYKKGETVKFQAGSRVFESKVIGVTSDGKLKTSDAFEHEWTMDEVRMKLV